jgi:hypothetical protein
MVKQGRGYRLAIGFSMAFQPIAFAGMAQIDVLRAKWAFLLNFDQFHIKDQC